MSLFKGFSLTVGMVSILITLLPISAMTQLSSDWRYWESFENEGERIDQYIDIASVQRTGNVWEFSQMDKMTNGMKSYVKIRVNCQQGYLDYVSSRIVTSNGQSFDNSKNIDILDGVQPYMTKPYCQLFTSGNLQKMPRMRTSHVLGLLIFHFIHFSTR